MKPGKRIDTIRQWAFRARTGFCSFFPGKYAQDPGVRPHFLSLNLIVVFILLVLAIGAVGYLYLTERIEGRHQEVNQELSAIANLKADQITSWYRERMRDARVILKNPLIENHTLQFLSNPSDDPLKHDLEMWAQRLATEYGYRVSLYRSDGVPLFVIPFDGGISDPADVSFLQAAIKTKEIMFEDLHQIRTASQNDSSTIRLVFWIPVWRNHESATSAEGVWKLESDPAQFLYPLIQTWPMPSKTSETLLVRREGNDVIYLNELRHRTNTALTLRIPLTSALGLPAALAIQGQEGAMEGMDYRGTPVLAACRAIPGTPWFIVAKTDLEEVYAPIRDQAWVTGSMIFICILGAAMGLGFLGRQRDNYWLKQQLNVEQDRYALASRVQYLNKHASDIILLANEEWNILEANVQALHVYGYTLEEMLSLNMRDLLVQESPADIERLFQEAEKPDGHIAEGLQRRGNGLTFVAESSLRSVTIRGEKFRQIIIRDITDRKRIEQALREREESLTAIFENIPVLILLMDSERKIHRINSVAAQFANATANEIIGHRAGEALRCLHANDVPEGCGFGSYCDHCTIRLTILDTLTTGASHHQVESSLPVRVDGHEKMLSFLVSSTPMHLLKKSMALVSILDITERQQAEEERIRLVTAIEQATEAILLIDVSGIIRYVNPAFDRISGAAHSEMLGENWKILFHCEQKGSLQKEMEARIQKGEVWKGTLTRSRRDGMRYEAEMTVTPVCDMKGQVTDYVMILRDITREMDLESQLFQSQKLEALGTLAGGIAHDFNNILQAVLGYADLAEAQVVDNSRASACIKEVINAGRRASELVSQILTFSRHSKRSLAPVRIQTVLKEAIKLLRGVLPSTIEIRQKIDENCDPVMADLMQVHQVLMNLCTNANHAMHATGVLEIVLDSVDLDKAASERYVKLDPGRYVRLTVRDTGSGIEEAVLPKIFDPFFTTKKDREGTGLGLAIVHNIIESHHGVITVQSTVGQGSTFTILLPALLPALEVTPAFVTLSTPPLGAERILFIDDEVSITRSGKRALEMLGYQVTACNNGMDALITFQENPYAFDLVVTDQTMPQLPGIELAKALLHIRPSLSIILCTGYSENVDEEGAKAAGIRDFIMKPVTSHELARHIRQVLIGEREEENAAMARLLLPTERV